MAPTAATSFRIRSDHPKRWWKCIRSQVLLITFLPGPFLLALNLQAQHIKDTLAISGIEVLATSIPQEAGKRITAIDSILLNEQGHKDLGSLLGMASPIFVKAYGQGGISTASFRGTSAQHTMVNWNGINLNSPMLGQTDLSNIPSVIAGQVLILHSTSAVSGIDLLPGAGILLSSDPFYATPLNVSLRLLQGSFQTHGLDLHAGIGNEQIGSSIDFYVHASKNNFNFTNNAMPGQPEEEREFAAWERQGITHQVHWNLRPAISISLYSWWQKSWRELSPPLMVRLFERNESLGEWRGVHSLIARGFFKEWSWRSTSGFVFHETDFVQRIAGKRSLSRSRSLQQQFAICRYLKQGLHVEGALNLVAQWVNSPHYIADIADHQGGLTAKLSYEPKSWLQSSISLAYVVSKQQAPGLLPSMGIEIQPWSALPISFKGHYGKTKRYPSLNEKYWVPGGNTSLLPEHGMATEGGIVFKPNIGKSTIGAEITYYKLSINDWIQWIPQGLSHFWSPVNLKSVQSSGLETNISMHTKIGRNELFVKAAYYFTSTKERSIEQGNGPQLIYIPKSMAHMHLGWRIGPWNMGLLTYYTDRRNTRVDGSAFMPAYFLADGTIGYTFDRVTSNLSAWISVQNLANTDYQVVAWYPMPRRSIEISFRLKLTQNKNNEIQ